ncbi:MAG: ABC-2 family transporter protein [Bacilli bacterium]|nr:ABC-2 family transporter protein [Bacilli bacterium]
MKFYFSYFKLRFITGLQYRAAAYAGLATQLFFGLIFIMVYLAFYESSSGKNPMEVSELVSYLWLNQAFFSLFYMLYKDGEIFDLIKNGNIAYELVRPKKLYFIWFAKIIGQRLSAVTLRCFPVLIISFFLPKPYNMVLPIGLANFILFILTLITGTLLMTSIVTLYHVITMKTLNEKGIPQVFAAIADLLSGLVVPIPFFPHFLQVISNYLPFRYVNDLPFRIYTGNIGLQEGLFGLGIQLLWIVLIVGIGYIMTNKSLKRVVVQGG